MQEILQKLSTALEPESDIAFAYLFGSVAKGRSGPLSDVDVAVYFHPGANAHLRFNRRINLMAKLGKALARMKLTSWLCKMRRLISLLKFWRMGN